MSVPKTPFSASVRRAIAARSTAWGGSGGTFLRQQKQAKRKIPIPYLKNFLGAREI